MRTEWLTEWEMLAVARAMEKFVNSCEVNEQDGKKLLEKLTLATHVRLTFPNEKS